LEHSSESSDGVAEGILRDHNCPGALLLCHVVRGVYRWARLSFLDGSRRKLKQMVAKPPLDFAGGIDLFLPPQYGFLLFLELMHD